jgi:hypothetical protein
MAPLLPSSAWMEPDCKPPGPASGAFSFAALSDVEGAKWQVAVNATRQSQPLEPVDAAVPRASAPARRTFVVHRHCQHANECIQDGFLAVTFHELEKLFRIAVSRVRRE